MQKFVASIKKSGWLLFFSIIIFVFSGTPIKAQTRSQEISDWQTQLVIEQDNRLSAQERLVYYTPVRKHGIYRYLPERYDDGRLIQIDWQSVTDEKGRLIPYQIKSSRDYSQAIIGDADETFSGEQVYVINYQAMQVLDRYESHEELYWDLVGEDWDFPIRQLTATITSPYAPIMMVDCYSGDFGQNDQLCQVEIDQAANTATIHYPHNLKAGQNVTIAVALAKENSLTWPSVSLATRLESWWYRYSGWVLALLPLATLVIIWLVNRMINKEEIFVDDQQITLTPQGETKRKPWFYRHPQLMFYDPFLGSDFSPAQAGYLLDNSYHHRQIVAEIIWLAEQGWLKMTKIEPPTKSGWQKFTSAGYQGEDDFLFEKKSPTKQNQPALKAYQQTLLDTIFAKGDQIKFSACSQVIVNKMATIRKQLVDSLVQEGYLKKTVQWTNGILFMVCLVGFLWSLENGSDVAGMINFLILIFSNLIIRPKTYRPTALGNYYLSLVKSLKETIRDGQWFYEQQEKLLWLEKMIPYAISLNVVKELSKTMSAIAAEPEVARELNSRRGLSNYWLMTNFMHSQSWERSLVRSFESSFNSQYTHLTRSSGSNGHGGSSFSGGGGSSGGGHGGGGGGSW